MSKTNEELAAELLIGALASGNMKLKSARENLKATELMDAYEVIWNRLRGLLSSGQTTT